MNNRVLSEQSNKITAFNSLTEIMSVYIKSYISSLNEIEKNNFLVDSEVVTPSDYYALTRRLSSSVSKRENEVFTPWTDEMFDKVIKRAIDEYTLDMELDKYEVIDGAWNNISFDEKCFIKHALELKDLIEIWLVRELGFADVWLVFPELSYEKEIAVISHCDKFLDERLIRNPNAKKIDFTTLTPENFTGEIISPSIHIMVGRGEDVH